MIMYKKLIILHNNIKYNTIKYSNSLIMIRANDYNNNENVNNENIRDLNTLNENDKRIIQPNALNIELMSHQKTLIHRMLEIEASGKVTIPNFEFTHDIIQGQVEKTAIINTNYAIIGDKVGAGKTLTTIGLIVLKKQIDDRNIEMGGGKFYSLKVNIEQNYRLRTNLIIVPHKILPQWKSAFEMYSPSLNVYTIALNKDIDNKIKIESTTKKNWNNKDVLFETEEIIYNDVNQYDVVLVSETMYKRFYRASNKYKWNRMIIDEADSIKLPSELTCKFNFLWLLTGTPSGLYNTRSHNFISKLFKDDEFSIGKYLIFKNDDDYINQSIKLPPPNRLKIRCVTPRELSLIKDLIPPSILQMINAGNTDEAIRTLNCNVDTDENILQVITKNLRDSISNKKIELDAEHKKFYAFSKDKESRIKFITTSIEKLELKYEEIKKKIYDLNDNYCPVCMSEFTNKVIVQCCKSCFCFDCLVVSLGEIHNNLCPCCRTAITHTDIHCFSSQKTVVVTKSSNNANKYELKDKLDVLVDLILNKPNGSFMVFANFMETFSKIETKLKEMNITYNILKGQATTVKKYIDEFKDKKVRVLMLNAQYFGAGMNLQMTTDLVMYHRFTAEMEEQIIGRAQRLGRKDPLNVYYLLHENESNNIDDKFKFNDQGDVHYMDWLEQNQINEENQINKLPINDDYEITTNSNKSKTMVNNDNIVCPSQIIFDIKEDVVPSQILFDFKNIVAPIEIKKSNVKITSKKDVFDFKNFEIIN